MKKLLLLTTCLLGGLMAADALPADIDRAATLVTDTLGSCSPSLSIVPRMPSSHLSGHASPNRCSVILHTVLGNLVNGQFTYPLHADEHEITMIILGYAYDADSKREDEAIELVKVGFEYTSYFNGANIYHIHNAIKLFEQALAIPEYQGERRAWVLSCTGRCYWGNSKFVEAIDYYKKALAIPEFQGERRALTLFRLGMIYNENNDTRNMAVECFKQAINIPECDGILKKRLKKEVE